MPRQLKIIAGLLLIAALLAGGGLAPLTADKARAETGDISFADLVNGAELIVSGTVVSQASYWNEAHNRIFTSVAFSVEEVLKGAAKADTVTVVLPGGEVDGICEWVSSAPAFQTGERAVVFLRNLSDEKMLQGLRGLSENPFEMFGGIRGKYAVSGNKVGGLSLSDFESTLNRIIQGQPVSTEELEIQPAPITFPYSYSGHSWPHPPSPIVSYFINENTPDCTGEGAAVQAASATWSNAGAKFSFNYAGTTTATSYALDRSNEVMWTSLGDAESQTLARTWVWYSPESGEIIECDLEFNDDYSWSTSGQFDIQTVALHEFGHFLSLDHSPDINSIMYPTYQGIRHTLSADDIAGIQFIYGSTVVAPTVTNYGGATDVTLSSARLNGQVTSTGGDNPTVHVYWGENDGGTVSDNWDYDVNLGARQAGSFYTDIDSLAPSTTYYYRCYGVNSAGGSWASGTASFDTAKALTSITVAPAGPTIHAGNTQQFTATGNYSDASTANLTSSVTWASSSPAIAGINAAGLATGYTMGSTNITASLGAVSGITTLTVSGAALENIYIEPRDPVITLDRNVLPSLQFYAVAGYSDGSSANVTLSTNWVSSNTTVASIDINGLAQTVVAGTTVISAQYGGISGNTTFAILDDTIAPEIEITSPVDGQALADTSANVTGRIDDPSASGELFINDVSRGAVSGAFNEAVTLHSGANVIRVEAVDSSHNRGSDTVVVNVSASRPAVTIISPVTGALTRTASLTITGTVSGNVTSASLVLNGAAHTIAVTGGGFSQAVNLAEGDNIIAVSAYPGGHAGDSAYLGTSGVRVVRLDTAPPAVTLNSPNSGQVLNNAGCDLSGTIDDPYVGSVIVTLNGSARTVYISAGAFYQRLTLAAGTNTITIQASDEAGNSATVSMMVIYNNSRPGVSIVAPINNLVTSAASLNVTGTVSDASITSASLYLNGASRTIPLTISGSYGQFNAGVTLAAGTNTIEVRAGTGTSGNVTVTRDSTAPDISIGLGEPGDSLAVTVTSNERLGSPPSVSVNATSLTMTPAGTYRWQGTYGSASSSIADGSYTVTVTTADLAGNTSSRSATFARQTLSVSMNQTATVAAGSVTLQVSTSANVTGASLSVTRYFTSPSGNAGSPTGAAKAVGVYIDITASAEIRDNLGQIYLQVGYDPASLPANTDESSFKLYLWDTATGTWQAVSNSGVNTLLHYIFGTVFHLSTFGGFGTAPIPPAPPALTPPAGGGGGGGGSGFTNISSVLDSSGKMMQEVVARSTDMQVSLVLPAGTVPRNPVGGLLSSVSIRRLAESEAKPVSPEYSSPVSWYYDIGPGGSTFSPPITLTFRYDPSLLPAGLGADSIFIARWDPLGQTWIKLESTADAKKKEVSAKLNHFSTYAAFSSARPAAFTLEELNVEPATVDAGQEVIVTAKVANGGDLTASYTTKLEIDGVVAQTKEVPVEGGKTEAIQFSLTSLPTGKHIIGIGNLSKTVEVKAPAEPSTTSTQPTTPANTIPPTPAAFVVTSISVTPDRVTAGEKADVTATVTNTGGSHGGYTVVLKVNGTIQAQQDIDYGPGETGKVSFPLTIMVAGSYNIDIAGNTGQLIATAPPGTTTPPAPPPVESATNWPLLALIAAIVIVCGVIIFTLLRGGRTTRRKR